jgi:hypothetical protein
MSKKKQKKLEVTQTCRGFDYIEFDDYYGQHCSLQKSSLMEPEAIWLGVQNTGPNLGSMYAGDNEKNVNVDVNCRMHLSQEQVKQLLPFLIKFAETGELS